jgi:hypothetical protein
VEREILIIVDFLSFDKEYKIFGQMILKYFDEFYQALGGE